MVWYNTLKTLVHVEHINAYKSGMHYIIIIQDFSMCTYSTHILGWNKIIRFRNVLMGGYQSRCRQGSTMTVSVHKKEFPAKTHSQRVKICLMTSLPDFFELRLQVNLRVKCNFLKGNFTIL